jgi:sulfide:quinone oxidoreductase
MRAFKGGNAVFTNPATQVKCGGAPQKIMYLADDHFRRRGIRDSASVIGAFAGTVMLGVPEINATLNRIVAERSIEMRFYHNLVAIDGAKKVATFDVTSQEGVSRKTIPFDMIHVTPPMSAPDFIKASPLAVAEGPHQGFVEVDIHTLQHRRYPNVFALGDAAALPTAKTGAAIRKQAPVLVKNLLAVMRGEELPARYDGYSSCPLLTGYRSLVLAEFKYDNKYAPSFPVDQTKERLDMYLLKRYALPPLYWHGMLRGLA